MSRSLAIPSTTSRSYVGCFAIGRHGERRQGRAVNWRRSKARGRRSIRGATQPTTSRIEERPRGEHSWQGGDEIRARSRCDLSISPAPDAAKGPSKEAESVSDALRRESIHHLSAMSTASSRAEGHADSFLSFWYCGSRGMRPALLCGFNQKCLRFPVTRSPAPDRSRDHWSRSRFMIWPMFAS